NSYLNNSLKSFSSSVKGTSNRFVSSKRTVGSAPSTPGPSSNNAASEALKRKRPSATSANSTPKLPSSSSASAAAAAAAAAASGAAAESAAARGLMSQVHFAITYLKEKEVALTADELARELNIRLSDTLRIVLKDNERIHYDAKSDTYAFKPIHNI